MEKENLILVHSFGTNSIILQGLAEYLENHFEVYLVDLPGFNKKIPPLAKVSWEGYFRYMEMKIESLSLDSYILGGISFGYYVVNQVKVDADKCRAILAMEPYLNMDSLQMSLLERIEYFLLLSVILPLGLGNAVWNSSWLYNYFFKNSIYPDSVVETIFENYNGRTFFRTAYLILTNSKEPSFHEDIPYVLAINVHDGTINSEEIREIFEKNLDELLVVQTTVEHYPVDLSADYFAENIPESEVEKIGEFLDEV